MVRRVLPSGCLRVVLAGPAGAARVALRDNVHAGNAAIVCGEAGDGPAALRIALEHRADLCLVLAEPEFDWPGVAAALARQAPPIPVLLAGAAPDDDTLLRAVGVGACGYVPPDLGANRLAAALLDAVSGGLPFPKRLPRLLIARLQAGAAPP